MHARPEGEERGTRSFLESRESELDQRTNFATPPDLNRAGGLRGAEPPASKRGAHGDARSGLRSYRYGSPSPPLRQHARPPPTRHKAARPESAGPQSAWGSIRQFAPELLPVRSLTGGCDCQMARRSVDFQMRSRGLHRIRSSLRRPSARITLADTPAHLRLRSRALEPADFDSESAPLSTEGGESRS